MRADRDDRALDGVEVAQQPHLDLGAGVVALERGGHDEQAVGAHERGEHAGAARERRGDEPAADAAEPDADPVVGAQRGGQPAREPGAARAAGRPAPRPRARPAAGARRCRTSARRRPDSRARRAPRSRPTAPSTTGWPGLTATPCTSSVPTSATTVGRVVVAPGARAGDDDHEVGACRGARATRGADPRRVVRERSGSDSTVQPTSRACAASISEFVSSSSPGAGS